MLLIEFGIRRHGRTGSKLFKNQAKWEDDVLLSTRTPPRLHVTENERRSVKRVGTGGRNFLASLFRAVDVAFCLVSEIGARDTAVLVYLFEANPSSPA